MGVPQASRVSKISSPRIEKTRSLGEPSDHFVSLGENLIKNYVFKLLFSTGPFGIVFCQ